MATSKLPRELMPVPLPVLEYSDENSGIHCNLRWWQRKWSEQEWVGLHRAGMYFDAAFVAPIAAFLEVLRTDTPVKVLLHFQGYGLTIGTAVVEVRSVFFTDDAYPRLDFTHPSGMEAIYGCPNFWGAFILAIARVPSTAEICVQPDQDSRKFLALAEKLIPVATP